MAPKEPLQTLYKAALYRVSLLSDTVKAGKKNNQQRPHKVPKDTKMNEYKLARTLVEQAKDGVIDQELVSAAIDDAPTARPSGRRRIEQEIYQAIEEDRPFRRTKYGRATSQVVVVPTDVHRTVRRVYLHGNLIAVVIGGLVVVNYHVFDQWPTVTTASRLRSLGLGASIRKGEATIDSPFVYNSDFA